MVRDLRILYLSNNPNVESTTRGLTSWLALAPAYGLSGTVVAPQAGGFTQWLARAGVPYVIDPMPWPDRRNPVPSMRSALKLAMWGRSQSVDIIHCNEHNVYPFAGLLRRFLPRPIVCHVRFRLERGFAEWAFRGKRLPDSLLWTTEWQKADCEGATQNIVPDARQRIVPPGVDSRRLQAGRADREKTRRAWGVAPEEIVVGTASALRPIKQLEDFVDMIEALARDDDRVVGLIAGEAVAGDEAYAGTLRDRIAATGLGRRLRCVGHVDDMAAFYHAIDVFVSTSQVETFGNSVVEAMACEKAVVAYRGGSVQEVVGDAGIILDDRDLGALISSVRQLISNPQARTSLGRAGYDRAVASYDPAAIVSSLSKLYRELAG